MTGAETVWVIQKALEETVGQVERQPVNVAATWNQATGVSVEVMWEVEDDGEA